MPPTTAPRQDLLIFKALLLGIEARIAALGQPPAAADGDAPAAPVASTGVSRTMVRGRSNACHTRPHAAHPPHPTPPHHAPSQPGGFVFDFLAGLNLTFDTRDTVLGLLDRVITLYLGGSGADGALAGHSLQRHCRLEALAASLRRVFRADPQASKAVRRPLREGSRPPPTP